MSKSSSTPVDMDVVIYRPVFGNYDHWAFAFYDHDTDTHRIYQVEGPQNDLHKVTLPKNPADSARMIKRISVGHMRASDLQTADQVIEGVKVQNDVLSWDCQEYVIDIMDKLENINLLGDNPKYEAVKKAIKKMRGDQESTRRIVERYDYDALDSDEENNDDEDEDEDEGDKNDSGPSNIRSKERVENSDSEED